MVGAVGFGSGRVVAALDVVGGGRGRRSGHRVGPSGGGLADGGGEVGEYFAGMATRVADFVDVGDHALGIDQVADPVWEVGVLIAGIAKHLVRRSDRLIGIGQQCVREAVFVAESLVVCRLVERDSEDGAAGIGERLSLITQALSFKRSTRRTRLGIPPQQNPVALVVGEADGVPVVVGRGEGGCL